MSQPLPENREARCLWSVSVRLGIEAPTERAALESASSALAEIGVALAHELSLIPHGIDRWVATADFDLSGIPAIEPDNAQTRLNYVAGHFPAEVLWTSRVEERRGTFEWPPNFWDRRSAADDHLLDPGIRAVVITVKSEA